MPSSPPPPPLPCSPPQQFTPHLSSTAPLHSEHVAFLIASSNLQQWHVLKLKGIGSRYKGLIEIIDLYWPCGRHVRLCNSVFHCIAPFFSGLPGSTHWPRLLTPPRHRLAPPSPDSNGELRGNNYWLFQCPNSIHSPPPPVPLLLPCSPPQQPRIRSFVNFHSSAFTCSVNAVFKFSNRMPLICDRV